MVDKILGRHYIRFSPFLLVRVKCSTRYYNYLLEL
jgi:hypothetical protein